jgi:hypothetical protein
MLWGIIHLLTIFIRLRIHSYYCKIWKYSFIDDFETAAGWDPDFVQFISAEDGTEITLREVDELANQVTHWAQDLGYSCG